MGERSFCSLLERFIRESGHTNFSFAKATGINRVNIQRYVSGGRVPSRPVFEQIRANLNLNRQEQRTFTEQYLLAGGRNDAPPLMVVYLTVFSARTRLSSMRAFTSWT